MLLAIDVGNTNIVLGVIDGDQLTQSWRLQTLRERTADEIGILVTHLFEQSALDKSRIDGIILSSVVPPLTGTMEEMAERYFGKAPLTVDPSTNTGMPVLYTPPSDVGADRVVNAVAAYETFGRARRIPVIAVDFGTATTFDVISAAGEYIGGVICPGIGISADALFQRAARLPRVDVRKPPSIIGQTTVTSMQAGLFFGYVSMVDGIVTRIRAELPDGERAICIATGGMAASRERNSHDPARRAGFDPAGTAPDLGTGHQEFFAHVTMHMQFSTIAGSWSRTSVEATARPRAHRRTGIRAGAGLGEARCAADGRLPRHLLLLRALAGTRRQPPAVRIEFCEGRHPRTSSTTGAYWSASSRTRALPKRRR